MELLGSCLRSERRKKGGNWDKRMFPSWGLFAPALQVIEFEQYSLTVHKKVVVAENQSYSSISKRWTKLQMFTADNDRYINKSSRIIQHEIRTVPHYKTRQPQVGFVKLPQKATNLIRHILFRNPRLLSVLNICQQGVNYYTLWHWIYLNSETLQFLMYTTPKMNPFEASCFT